MTLDKLKQEDEEVFNLFINRVDYLKIVLGYSYEETRGSVAHHRHPLQPQVEDVFDYSTQLCYLSSEDPQTNTCGTCSLSFIESIHLYFYLPQG